jgi:hypothetical protein
MGKTILLKVGNKYIPSVEVTYDDLVILYKQYIDVYNEVPIYSKCDSKHNMPQGRIINRVLKENNITYNDFLLQFGKVSHVRTQSKDYDLYIEKFKKVSDELGRALTQAELFNNKYGLPNPNWFIKYCPDKNVKSYNDFVLWSGYNSNKPEKDKDFVIKTLIRLEKELDRPITRYDISYEKTGFSMTVLKRLFGGLKKAKKEIGLMPTQTSKSLYSFEYYKNTLTEALNSLYLQTGRKFVTWHDLECGLYHKNNIEHKSMTKAFKREGLDIFAYIKSLGFEMNPNNFSFKYTFDDGERTTSTMEFDFSTYIRSIGYEYNKTYLRDVMYKTFTNSDKKRKINCDYCLLLPNNEKLYIEIAGVIPSNIADWRSHKYKYKRHSEYQQKMLYKEKILVENNCNYLFLFSSEMKNDVYKDILQNKINEILREAA